MIRVLIIAETRLYREGLAQMLDRQSGLAVVGMRSNRREVAADLQELKPDVVLLAMGTAEIQATVREVHQLAPTVPVVAFGVAELEEDILACLDAGFAGFVTREASLKDLIAVVENAARGELQCSPRIAGSILRRLAAATADREPDSPKARLTTREQEIICLLEQNLSNKQIAARLGIEVATVKNHVHNLLEKLKVHRRTEAARLFSRSPSQSRKGGDHPGKH